jgi:hypothetical protein
VAAVAVSPGADRTVQAAGELCIDAACGAGGEYHAITPTRILDTRDPALDVAPKGRKPMKPKTGDSVFDLQVVGKGGLPTAADQVLAVAVNITVVNPSREGYLRAFGSGAAEGESALVNFTGGAVVPNSAILRPGANGKLSIRLVSPGGLGSADVVVDIFGWFSTSKYTGTDGARMLPAGPGRIFDSRRAPANPLGTAEQVKIPIRGADSFDPAINNVIPNSTNVVAALVNVSAVNIRPGSRPTYLSALPTKVAAGKIPSTATVNVVTGQVRSVLALVPVGSDGAIWIYNRFGDIDVTVDVMGYLIKNQDPATRAGRVVPLVSPFRAFDTREPAFGKLPLPPGNAEDWSFEAFVNDVKIGTDPVGPQSALIGNLTAARLDRQYPWVPVASYVTAFPTPAGSSTAKPSTANLTLRDGEVVPNMVLLKYGGTTADPYQIRFYNKNGYLDYVLDVSAVILAD